MVVAARQPSGTDAVPRPRAAGSRFHRTTTQGTQPTARRLRPPIGDGRALTSRYSRATPPPHPPRQLPLQQAQRPVQAVHDQPPVQQPDALDQGHKRPTAAARSTPAGPEDHPADSRYLPDPLGDERRACGWRRRRRARCRGRRRPRTTQPRPHLVERGWPGPCPTGPAPGPCPGRRGRPGQSVTSNAVTCRSLHAQPSAPPYGSAGGVSTPIGAVGVGVPGTTGLGAAVGTFDDRLPGVGVR